jgi:hypothetical protein
MRGGKNHETQHQRRKAPDQSQCQFSAINERVLAKRTPGVNG